MNKLIFCTKQAVADVLTDYNKLLKVEYDQEWKPKLNQCLEEVTKIYKIHQNNILNSVVGSNFM